MKSPEVPALVFRLHRILIKGQAFVHVIWIAGKRMINQGTDGLSQSDLTNGVMRGVNMLKFVPLHHMALERQKDLILHFIQDVTGMDTPWKILQPEDWYFQPQDTD
ncbi:hypothetical protein ACA910_002192 [Epithemia clementina (nom. ined.)]